MPSAKFAQDRAALICAACGCCRRDFRQWLELALRKAHPSAQFVRALPTAHLTNSHVEVGHGLLAGYPFARVELNSEQV
jgi:hypothetical protein